MINDAFGWDPLAKIGLDGVDTHVEESSDMTREPLAGGWVGEIHDGHARLPKIGLPHRTVGVLDEIAFCRTLGEEPRALGDVGVDPYADFQPARVEALEHPSRIRKNARIPLEIRPLELAHPKTIEMENTQRQIALLHSFDELVTVASS